MGTERTRCTSTTQIKGKPGRTLTPKERERSLQSYVLRRLVKGWTPEQLANVAEKPPVRPTPAPVPPYTRYYRGVNGYSGTPVPPNELKRWRCYVHCSSRTNKSRDGDVSVRMYRHTPMRGWVPVSRHDMMHRWGGVSRGR